MIIIFGVIQILRQLKLPTTIIQRKWRCIENLSEIHHVSYTCRPENAVKLQTAKDRAATPQRDGDLLYDAIKLAKDAGSLLWFAVVDAHYCM
jgi:hypothetical protein